VLYPVEVALEVLEHHGRALRGLRSWASGRSGLGPRWKGGLDRAGSRRGFHGAWSRVV
jgi:hypothetical protein